MPSTTAVRILTGPFRVKYSHYGYGDSPLMEEDESLERLLRLKPEEGITDEAQAIRMFNEWCVANSSLSFGRKPELYKVVFIAKFDSVSEQS